MIRDAKKARQLTNQKIFERDGLLEDNVDKVKVAKIAEEVDWGISQGFFYIESLLKLSQHDITYLKRKGYRITYEPVKQIHMVSW